AVVACARSGVEIEMVVISWSYGWSHSPSLMGSGSLPMGRGHETNSGMNPVCRAADCRTSRSYNPDSNSKSKPATGRTRKSHTTKDPRQTPRPVPNKNPSTPADAEAPTSPTPTAVPTVTTPTASPNITTPTEAPAQGYAEIGHDSSSLRSAA